MKLHDKYYNYILKGTKRIEIRLNDEKRRQIKIGDRVRFLKLSNINEYFEVTVVDLLKFKSFEDLINNYDISLLSDKSMTKEELINVLKNFYTKQEEKEYGVLGIVFEIDILNN